VDEPFDFEPPPQPASAITTKTAAAGGHTDVQVSFDVCNLSLIEGDYGALRPVPPTAAESGERGSVEFRDEASISLA
jgi:hypothetical protein